jgi:hypothetical protein
VFSLLPAGAPAGVVLFGFGGREGVVLSLAAGAEAAFDGEPAVDFVGGASGAGVGTAAASDDLAPVFTATFDGCVTRHPIQPTSANPTIARNTTAAWLASKRNSVFFRW